jgi:hypothetical protein
MLWGRNILLQSENREYNLSAADMSKKANDQEVLCQWGYLHQWSLL